VVETITIARGADLNISWDIPHFDSLSQVLFLINKTQVMQSYSPDDPTSIFCIPKIQIYDICLSNIGLYSTVKNGMFNLVIKNISSLFNGSSITAVFYYATDLDHPVPHTVYKLIIVGMYLIGMLTF